MADQEGWTVSLIPEPQVATKVVYRYNFEDAPILVRENRDSPYLVVRIDITIETVSDVEGGYYTDWDAYGYLATKDGERDLRSKLTVTWCPQEAREQYVLDAQGRFDAMANYQEKS